MSNQHSKKRRLKYVFVAFACAASFSLTGLAAACKTDETKEDEKTTSVEDTQLLKNGNFEFFKVPDQKDGEPAPEYLINTPTNWNKQGTTSYTMSGIIGTSSKAWEKLTAEDLANRLNANNALESSASNYKSEHIDFNGMKSSDILYKDSYGALKYGTISSSKDGDTTKYYIDEGDSKVEIFYNEENNTYYYDSAFKKPVNKELIDNPLAHNIFYNEDKTPYFVDDKGEKKDIFTDENGDYFLEYDKAKEEYSQSVGHVLMLHNYSNSNHNGIAQNYASVEVSLPANTSAEVSVWVKTSNLLFAQGQLVNDDQDRGANITVTHTAGSSTLDDFKITSINTEKLIGGEKASDEYNGWVKYTVYVNACNFASSTISIKLGLGDDNHPVEGYAFFDDVTVTKYVDLSECPSYTAETAQEIVNNKAVCSLKSNADEKIFEADTYKRNNVELSERFSNAFHYLLDLASETDYTDVDFGNANASAGLTVDGDNYVSSKTNDFNNTFANKEMTGTAKLPDDLKNLKIDGKEANPGLDTSGDLLTLVKANHTFTELKNANYNEQLTKALENASKLPNADENSDMLVLFSAKGAAYTASFDLSIAPEHYQIISFWVKTSDMDGKTAATVKISEKGNDSNSSNVTLDTSDIVTDIDDEHENIYDNWVQCFFFVHNDTPDKEGATSAELHIEFSFGNTTIKGTTVTSYKPGWAALANVQTLNVSEEIFAYTGSGNYTASLTVKEDEKKTANVFDDYMEGQKPQIETGFADPSSFTGTNGGSSKVASTGVISPFDAKNTSESAGLLNRDYVEEYAKQQWYLDILNSFNVSATDAVANWNQVFGTKSVQPLVISNSTRKNYIIKKDADKDTYKTYYYYDEDKQEYVKVTDEEFDAEKKYYSLQEVLNYGFIGENETVSADGYTTISVRVKVSAGAVAYIYLVDTSDTTKVLGFNAPSYSFWYDEDGNVLKSELDESATLAQQRANVLYTLRSDGLYEDAEHNLRANTWNYTKLYNANITYYKDGKAYSLDQLVEGETYYADEACTKEAPHFLVTDDGTKVFEFDNKYDYIVYHYIVKGETQKENVLPFEIDKGYERFNYKGVSEEYTAVVEPTNGKWVTVNFVIHAGSDSKQYRLELWSGKRGEYKTEGNDEGGTVIFDYSYTSITSNDLLSHYENEIIKAYQTILAKYNLLDKDALKEIALTDKSISDYNLKDYKELIDKAVAEGRIPKAEIDGNEILNSYKAHYYAYSLYDSANFVPFNKDVADENSTGYKYSANDYEETLAYLEITSKPAENSNEGYTYTVFTDYSALNQSIELDTGDTDEDEDEEDEDKDTANVWLLASSIILVAALIFAMIAILIKDTLKKNRRNKVLAKNNYNGNKANHYFRRLGIKKEEIEEVEADKANEANAEETEQPVEEANAEEVTEQPVEETSVEEAPNEESAENGEDSEN